MIGSGLYVTRPCRRTNASPNFELPEAGNLVQCGDIAVVRGCTTGYGSGADEEAEASAWSGVGRVRTCHGPLCGGLNAVA